MPFEFLRLSLPCVPPLNHYRVMFESYRVMKGGAILPGNALWFGTIFFSSVERRICAPFMGLSWGVLKNAF
jgi:hypothetical protein